MKKGEILKNRVGEININNQGIAMKIIAYRRMNDIDILFLDGYNEIKRTRYEHFLHGKVRCNSATKKYANQKIKNKDKEKLDLFFKKGFEDKTLAPIPNKDGYYADVYGNVYNSKGKKLAPIKRGKYLAYDLPLKGDAHGIILAHRAVCSAFIPNPENKPEVNHKDGNKYNNNISNLEWVSRSENQKHRYTCLGHNHIGENNTMTKLTAQDIIDIIDMRYNNKTLKEIAKSKNVSITTISTIINRKSWVHVSYNPSDIKRQVLKL